VRNEAQAQRNSGPFKVIWGEPDVRVEERLSRLRNLFQKATEAGRPTFYTPFNPLGPGKLNVPVAQSYSVL